MKFRIDKEKTVEALLYIVSRYGEVGRFHALKTLYFADREHLRRYGRPVTGDRYIAMENGPVPSWAYDAVKSELPEPERSLVAGAIRAVNNGARPSYVAQRSPNMSFFSKSDLKCLDWAYEHCKGRSFGSISDETHAHVAWKSAALNAEMKVADMLDDIEDSIREEAENFAAYGVL